LSGKVLESGDQLFVWEGAASAEENERRREMREVHDELERADTSGWRGQEEAHLVRHSTQLAKRDAEQVEYKIGKRTKTGGAYPVTVEFMGYVEQRSRHWRWIVRADPLWFGMQPCNCVKNASQLHKLIEAAE
jgi:hypothetical protein